MAVPIILQAENLASALVRTPSGKTALLRDLNLQLTVGESVAIVGARGAGKSTLLRTLAVLQKPSAGRLDFEGVELTRLPDHKLRPLRQKLQYVGGHPARALAAHVTVRAVLQEPLDIHRLGTAAERQTRIEAALEQWRLNAWLLNRLVASLSTTLRQKLALARALIFRPRVLLADEVVDHLEPAAAVPMLEHLARLCRADAITWLWTTRDATLAARFADRVLRVEGGTLSPA